MNLIRCLIEALNPCVHQDRVVATMYDNPQDPKVTTVVSSCDICGRTTEAVFMAKGVCQHHWETFQRVSVMPKDTKSINGDEIPLFYSFNQKCTKCGDLRKVDMK